MTRSRSLRHPVTIQRRTTGIGDTGEYTESWSTLGRTKAAILPQSGRQFLRADRETNIQGIRIMLRGSPDLRILETDRVLFKDRHFEIVAVLDKELRNRDITLIANEIIGIDIGTLLIGKASEADKALGSFDEVTLLAGDIQEGDSATGVLSGAIMLVAEIAEGDSARGAIANIEGLIGSVVEGDFTGGSLSISKQLSATSSDSDSASGSISTSKLLVGSIQESDSMAGALSLKEVWENGSGTIWENGSGVVWRT